MEVVDVCKYIGMILYFGSETVMEVFPLIISGLAILFGFYVPLKAPEFLHNMHITSQLLD